MRHMYGGAVLIALAALAISGAFYDTARADDSVVRYEVVTKDPSCTALRMESIGAVTRLTPLRDDYNLTEIVGGVPLFIQVPEDRASDVAQSLLELPQVLSVQKADQSLISNHTAPPLEINPNSYINTILANCYPAIPQSIEEALRYAIIQGGGVVGAAQGSGPAESRERVIIFVHNITSMVAYLEENGAKVHGHSVGVYGGVTNSIHADIPAPLAVPLSERDDFHYMHTVSPIVSLGHGSDHTTQGLGLHQRAAEWHDAGYDGSGISVGVIDRSFANIRDAQLAGDVPLGTSFWCPRATAITGCVNTNIPTNQRDHGTQVAEIVMDMAPGADLFIGMVGELPIDNVVNQMVNVWGVDVIVASVTPSEFEGPGDGSNFGMGSWLNAIDTAVAANVTWVNAAGNHNDRTWYAENPGLEPRTINGNPTHLLVFSTTSGTNVANNVTLVGDTRYGFVLRWDGAWGDSASIPMDLNVYLVHGTTIVASSIDNQALTLRPMESFGHFVPRNDGGTYSLIVESSSGASPEWVQLISFGEDLEFATGDTGPTAVNSYSLLNNAESDNAGMMAVGAVDRARGIEDYSSRGPTVDGQNHIRPDVVAVTDVTTSIGTFGGTSAATPHVGGLVALYQDRHDGAMPPAQVATYITEQAEPLPPGSDTNDIFGHGFARLPPPHHAPPNAVGTALSPGVWTYKDANIHQGRSSTYGLFVHDPDSDDTLILAATSSDTSVVTVTPAPGHDTTMRQ